MRIDKEEYKRENYIQRNNKNWKTTKQKIQYS